MHSIPEDRSGFKPIGEVVPGLVISLIVTCPDERTRQERIRIALGEGLISEETADTLGGLA